MNLKNIRTAAIAAVIAAAMPAVFAQTATTTTEVSTTTSAGTVSAFDAGASTLQITTEDSTSPVAYSYSKETKFVDTTGAPVEPSVIKSGVPVTVHYDEDGDKRTVSKVVVAKSGTSTTTTGGGAVVEKEASSTTTTTTTED